MIGDGRADREIAVDPGSGRRRNAGFLKLNHDPGVGAVSIGAAITANSGSFGFNGPGGKETYRTSMWLTRVAI